jgi:leucyl-tRNA synthetase
MYQSRADNEVFSVLVLMLSPIVPHFAEELWERLGNRESILKARWPEYDPHFLIEEKVVMVIQVNGKVRSKIEVSADIQESELRALALADEKIKSWIQDRPVRNVILIPQKLINIVV